MNKIENAPFQSRFAGNHMLLKTFMLFHVKIAAGTVFYVNKKP